MRITRCLRDCEGSLQTSKHYHNPYNALTQVFEHPGRTTGNSALRYAVKENICTTIGTTTCSSKILGISSDRPYVSPFHATCVSLLDQSGAIMTAKTNMDEFGMGSFGTNNPLGPILNPHASNRCAGGSSGGSAAALAMDRVAGSKLDFSLGTDTGGSIRAPASYCGIYGFKPSYGRVSRWGVVPYANSLDTVGIMARKTGGLDIIRGVFRLVDRHDPQDPTSISDRTRSSIHAADVERRTHPRKIRIGIPAEYHIEELLPDVLATWQSAIHDLSSTGYELVAVSLPLTRTALSAYYIIAPSEASSNLQKYSGVFYGARSEHDRSDSGQLYAATRELFGEEVKKRILMGCLSLSADKYDNYYLQAQKIRRMVVEEFNSVFRRQHPFLSSRESNETGVDYLLTPVTTGVAPLLSRVAEMSSTEGHAGDVFTVPASLGGLPAISVPVGADQTGLPIGLQVLGQYGDDEGVLDFASTLYDSCSKC